MFVQFQKQRAHVGSLVTWANSFGRERKFSSACSLVRRIARSTRHHSLFRGGFVHTLGSLLNFYVLLTGVRFQSLTGSRNVSSRSCDCRLLSLVRGRRAIASSDSEHNTQSNEMLYSTASKAIFSKLLSWCSGFRPLGNASFQTFMLLCSWTVVFSTFPLMAMGNFKAAGVVWLNGKYSRQCENSKIISFLKTKNVMIWFAIWKELFIWFEYKYKADF